MTSINEKQINILQVAEKLFAEKGFDGTSIRDISKEANINIAMISYYFGSKEKLLESLILFRTQDLKIKLENLLATELSPIQKIENYLELYLNKIDSNRNIYHILQTEISNNKRVLDLKEFIEIKKGNLNTLKKIIEEGQSINIFKKNINIELITPTILGTYFHFIVNRVFFEEILNLDSDQKYNQYIKNELTQHIQKTIKSIIYEI